MTEPAIPQFGGPASAAPRDRPAAFAVVERGGKIAVVHIRRAEAAYTDLPGGALEAGEDDAAACVREFGEETGLVVRPARLLGRASQFLTTVDDEAVNNRCALFAAELVGEDASLKVEADHTLGWLDPAEALAVLRHDAHAWAVTLWLRARRRRGA